MAFSAQGCFISVCLLATVLARIEKNTATQDPSHRGACRAAEGSSHAPVEAGSLLQAKLHERSNATGEWWRFDCIAEHHRGSDFSYLRSYRTLGCPLPHQTRVFEVSFRHGVDLSIQIPNIRGLTMMVYAKRNLPDDDNIQCTDLRNQTGSEWILTGGDAATLGGGSFFENAVTSVGYTWLKNRTDAKGVAHRRRRSGSSSLFESDTTILIAMHRSGDSSCATAARYFRLEFGQPRNTNCHINIEDVSCKVCGFKGCEQQQSSAASSAHVAGGSSSSLEATAESFITPFNLAGQAFGDSSATFGNSFGGLAPPTGPGGPE